MFLDVLMRRTVYLDRRLHLSVQLGGSDSLAGLLGEHEGQQLHGRGGLPHGQ